MSHRANHSVTVREKRVKGDILLAVLEHIARGIVEFAELSEAIVDAGYGASYRRMVYVRERNRAWHAREQNRFLRETQVRKRYQKLLSELRTDGLLAEHTNGSSKILTLTEKGLKKLRALRERKKTMLTKPRYPKENASVFSIVTFDVPEAEKRKREWLRSALRELGFRMVQKSVWLGKVKIPKVFLDDLRRFELVDFVEIFQITKSGSLRHLM